jgi:hypothetical protein
VICKSLWTSIVPLSRLLISNPATLYPCSRNLWTRHLPIPYGLRCAIITGVSKPLSLYQRKAYLSIDKIARVAMHVYIQSRVPKT